VSWRSDVGIRAQAQTAFKFAVEEEEQALAWAVARYLRRDTCVMPFFTCCAVGLPPRSTYAEGAQRVREDASCIGQQHLAESLDALRDALRAVDEEPRMTV
jgi:hypothetical protein